MADTDDTPPEQIDNSVAPSQSDVTAAQDVKARPSKQSNKFRKILTFFMILFLVSGVTVVGLRVMVSRKAAQAPAPAPAVANESTPVSVPAPMAANESRPVSVPAPLAANESKPVSVPAKTQLVAAPHVPATITKTVMKDTAPPLPSGAHVAAMSTSSSKKPVTPSFVRRNNRGEELLHDFTRESR